MNASADKLVVIKSAVTMKDHLNVHVTMVII